MSFLPQNSFILNSMVLCFESSYRTSRASCFGVNWFGINWKRNFYRKTGKPSFSTYGKVHSQCKCNYSRSSYRLVSVFALFVSDIQNKGGKLNFMVVCLDPHVHWNVLKELLVHRSYYLHGECTQ